MTFQSSMGPGKSRCDIPSGTTQRKSYPKNNIFSTSHLWLDLDCQLEEEDIYKKNYNIYTTNI